MKNILYGFIEGQTHLGTFWHGKIKFTPQEPIETFEFHCRTLKSKSSWLVQSPRSDKISTLRASKSVAVGRR